MHRSISVIIPSNRGGAYLCEAVESVTAQTVPVTEVILVDDGSPAPGLSAIARDLRLTYIRQEAAGISVARNSGVAAANGDWIAFLDDDDVWDPRRIELQQRALDAHLDAIASFTGGWYMDSDGARFGRDWPAPAASSDEMISYAVVPPRITTLLVRRDAYQRVGGCNPAMEPAEDNDLILRLLQLGQFAAVDRSLVGYRRHDANITSRRLRGRIAMRLSVRGQLDAARIAGDARLEALLKAQLRALRRNAAVENLDDVVGALRSRDWSYAGNCVLWGIRTVPINSLDALRLRLLRRLRS